MIFEDLIKPTLEMFTVQAEHHEIRLASLNGLPKRMQFMMDKMRVQQIIINLLQNSLEYSK